MQLGIAAMLTALSGNWLVMIITFQGGNFIAQIQAALFQWREEMWKARPIELDKPEVVCLNRGNGSSYVMVIRSEGNKTHPKLRLANLAGGREVRSEKMVYANFVLVILWFVHILTMQARRVWETTIGIMLVTGAAGMLQNIIVAGARRKPEALEFHLKNTSTIHKDRVFKALKEAEWKERRVGCVLSNIFFREA
ncbi:hypothetical protein V5O48_014371 [Marasmius crinis-equi]|uniref:Uncharacterized protein n=1 Tax=Marasmius crinis-equi TaxID=585013 RepID=A0ABR3EXI4_9AGAR